VSDTVLQIVLMAIPAILAITLHEAAHGYAALALGDDTARKAGRLSLNPLRHVDRVGTVLLPGFLLLISGGLFMFGWAKPVPVAAWKFRDPRRGMALVAIAGPAMNFLLAWLGALLVPLPAGPVPPGVRDPLGFVLDSAMTQHPIVAPFLIYFILFNLVLGLFNLLPIPPLDGGRIAVGLLPAQLARYWARLERVGLLLVIFLVFLLPLLLRQFGITFDPFRDALGVIEHTVLRLLFYLAGHDIGVGAEVQHV